MLLLSAYFTVYGSYVCFDDADSPFSSNFGDLQSEVHRIVTGRFPLQDFITAARLILLLGEK